MANECVCPAYGIGNHIYVKEPGGKAQYYTARYSLFGQFNVAMRLTLHYVKHMSDGCYFLLCTEAGKDEDGFYGFTADDKEEGEWKAGKAGEEPEKV